MRPWRETTTAAGTTRPASSRARTRVTRPGWRPGPSGRAAIGTALKRRQVDNPEPEKGDGQVWFDFIAHELAAEHAQRAWLDARGTAIITSSGVFITAVFALGAFVLGKSFV